MHTYVHIQLYLGLLLLFFYLLLPGTIVQVAIVVYCTILIENELERMATKNRTIYFIYRLPS